MANESDDYPSPVISSSYFPKVSLFVYSSLDVVHFPFFIGFVCSLDYMTITSMSYLKSEYV